MDGVSTIYKILGKVNKTTNMIINNPNTQTVYTNVSQDYVRDPISGYLNNIQLSPKEIGEINKQKQDNKKYDRPPFSK